MILWQLNNFRFNKPCTAIFIHLFAASIICINNVGYAQTDFQYFEQPEMDFWKLQEAKNKAKVNAAPIVKPHLAQETNKATDSASSSSFPWKKYLDPKNDEFFREGDYLPPAPFMEIARDPSDENIKYWFKYLESKNEITRRLQAKLSEYAEKHPVDQPTQDASIPTPTVQIPIAPPISPLARRFRLRLYFDSACPHCEKMMETLKQLTQRGYSIELKQIDSNTQARSRIPFPVTSATPSELKQYGIESVPLLLVGDLKARTFFKIQGYQPEESVLQALSQFSTTHRGEKR